MTEGKPLSVVARVAAPLRIAVDTNVLAYAEGAGDAVRVARARQLLRELTAVGGVERSGGLLRITVFRTGQQAEGRIQLVLDEEPMALRQWVVVDGQNRATRVTLTQAEVGGRFSPALFAFNDPRFREQLGERQN